MFVVIAKKNTGRGSLSRRFEVDGVRANIARARFLLGWVATKMWFKRRARRLVDEI
jgi:hypothetical protein